MFYTCLYIKQISAEILNFQIKFDAILLSQASLLVTTNTPPAPYRLAQFTLSQPRQKTLSYCGHKPKQFRAWVEALPMTQPNKVSILLYKLLPEVNQLKIKPHHHLELLGIIRPYLNQCTDSLAQGFIQQPFTMSEYKAKTAAIAQALQRHLSDGYIAATKVLLTGRNNRARNTALAHAIYHAMFSLGQLLYRSCQLYTSPPPSLWRKLIALYEVASEQGCLKTVITDDLLANQTQLSIQNLFHRALVLGCSHTNQLRQVEITQLYHALERWSNMVSVGEVSINETTISDEAETRRQYWLNLDTDEGPFSQARCQSQPQDRLLAIKLYALSDLLSSHQDYKSNNHEVHDITSHIRPSLLKHLLSCWQMTRKRHHQRQRTQLQLDLCIGLRAAHDQLLAVEGLSFEQLICEKRPFPPLVVSEAGTEPVPSADNVLTPSTLSDDSIIAINAINISNNGYCLCWNTSPPSQLKTGEIVLLKQSSSSQWQVGIIRWAQQINRNTYAGVEILAGQALASAATITLENGKATPFFRTITVTPNTTTRTGNSPSTSKQAPNVLTPPFPFACRQHIQLCIQKDCHQVLLTQLVSCSGIVSQYRYQKLQN